MPTFVLAFIIALTGCAQVDAEPAVVSHWGGDLLGAGSAVAAADTVDGDVMLAGGGVRFTGAAGGDYLGAGGRHVVGGNVGGSARVAAGEIRIDAEIGRNATLAGGSVRLGENGSVEGNGYLAGGLVEVAGAVDGNLRAGGGEVVVDGVVGGDLNVESGSLRLGSDAEVGGDLRHRLGPGDVEVTPGAEIGGETVALPPRPEAPGVGWWAVRLLWSVAFLFTGAILVAVLPGAATAASRTLQDRPGASVGLGVIGLVVTPAVVGVLLMTVLGIPLAMMLLAAFAALLYLSRVIPAVWIGRRLLRDAKPGRAGAVGAFLLGGLLLVLAGLVPVVGWLVGLVATLLGVGAALLAAGRLRPMPEPRPAPGPAD